MAWIRACGGGSPAVPDGRTVTPINDVTVWQQCAGIANPTYTTLAEVLADVGILSTLMASNNAVDYLVRCKEWCGTALVPIMTSNTTPSGVASVSSKYSDGTDAYMLFDSNDATGWASANNQVTNQWASYEFPSPKLVNSVRIITSTVAGRIKYYKVQCSNDSSFSTYTDLASGTASNSASQTISHVFNITSEYKYFRVMIVDVYSGSVNAGLGEIQYYSANICDNQYAMQYIGANNYCADTLLADSDWCSAICNSTYFESVLNVKVPTMTSNTTPSGVVSANSTASGYPAYQAFDGSIDTFWCSNYLITSGTGTGWIQYMFSASVKCVMATFKNKFSTLPIVSWEVLGSNDASTWVSLASGTTISGTSLYKMLFTSNISSYKYYRWNVTQRNNAGGGSYIPTISELQFYGREDV